MIVYRIEKNGIGPYWHTCVGNKLYAKISSHSGKIDRPGPTSDGIEKIPGHTYQEMYYGFNTEQKLKQWFRGTRSELRRNGFEMVTYIINDKYCSVGASGQVGFIKSKARVMQTKSIP